MRGPPLMIRCPHCGASLLAETPPGPTLRWYTCPHCRAPVPAVGPRDPPPLFSWEVFPQLYPPLPVPRRTRFTPKMIATAALVVATGILLVLGGFLAYYGLEALQPQAYTISGTVYERASSASASMPAPGVFVNLSGENGFQSGTVSDPAGDYSFSMVPGGGVTINASARGFGPQVVYLFVSSVYTSNSVDTVDITLTAGIPSNVTVTSYTPFLTLESLVASTWSGTILFCIVALVCALGAYYLYRKSRPTLGVAGGVAAALSPLVLLYLSVLSVFPIAESVSEAALFVGLLAAGLLGAEMAATGRAPDRD